MGHIELRQVQDDDVDAVFEVMRDADSVERAAFPTVDANDRAAFDEWMLQQRSSDDTDVFVVTEDGGFAGTAALFTADGERRATYWIARNASGRGVGTEALRLLVLHERERPLYARVAAAHAASPALLARVGFTEFARDESADEIVYVLPPTLE